MHPLYLALGLTCGDFDLVLGWSISNSSGLKSLLNGTGILLSSCIYILALYPVKLWSL